MFRKPILSALAQLREDGFFPADTSFEGVVIEPPKDPLHGDVSTNAPLALAKAACKRPQEIAEKLHRQLKDHPDIESVSVAGGGFLNFSLKIPYWHSRLLKILAEGPLYGKSTLGANQPINVEYVSANPTGPLHAGHGRVAVVADIIANLLEAVGFHVTREYYINDAGGQIDVLARSTLLRYQEALGEEISAIPEGYYPGEYLKEVAQALVAQEGKSWLSKSEEETLNFMRAFAVRYLMQEIREDLKTIGIVQDTFTSELKIHQAGAVDQSMARLQQEGLIYEGILERPKGEKGEDWSPIPLLLFKSTKFGDNTDRALKKSTGEWTYFAGDIAYHQDKISRGFSHMINVWGADHASHVTRIQAAVKALSNNTATLEVILAQIVHFVKDGAPLKMSKRAGTFVTVSDIVEQIGSDAFRFLMASRKHDSQFTLDLNQALEQTKNNPVFYVQYAHARICSVLRMGKEMFPEADLSVSALAKAPLRLLTDEGELNLLKILADFPRQVENAARAREPHRIVHFLEELAHRFHTLWNKGKQETVLRFLLPEDPELSFVRLALLQGTLFVIASGLTLLGVKPVEEMR